MKIAVITPSYKTPLAWLKACHESVTAQSYPCTHFIVFDGKADSNLEHANELKAKILSLDGPHCDVGNTARAIGSISALRLGFDAVAWLDADNWYHPEHIESLVSVVKNKGVNVAASLRDIHDLDGSFLGLCPEVSSKNFIDTNCYLVTKGEAGLISLWWLMDEKSHNVGDRVLFSYLTSRKIPWASSDKSTVSYRTPYTGHYLQFGKKPPPGAKESFRLSDLLRIIKNRSEAKDFYQVGNLQEAFQKVIQAKKERTAILGIDLLRAVIFVEMGKPADAYQAALEELRQFPDSLDAKKLIYALEQEFPTSSVQCPPQREKEYQEILNQVRLHTMLPEPRLYSLYRLAKEICERDIPGNFVECGVAGGGATALLAEVIKKYSKIERFVFACDSFEGMPPPSSHDRNLEQAADDTGWGTGTCAAPQENILNIAQSIGVQEQVRIVKGYFERTLPEWKDQIGPISLLHIDCDWYESTKTVLRELYDKCVPNALCQIDDYGYWKGMKKAFDEFQIEKNLTLEITSIDGMSAWFRLPS